MARISIETMEELSNGVREIKERVFDIPDEIDCPLCKNSCYYSMFEGAYSCKCGYNKKAEQYLKEELGIL